MGECHRGETLAGEASRLYDRRRPRRCGHRAMTPPQFWINAALRSVIWLGAAVGLAYFKKPDGASLLAVRTDALGWLAGVIGPRRLRSPCVEYRDPRAGRTSGNGCQYACHGWAISVRQESDLSGRYNAAAGRGPALFSLACHGCRFAAALTSVLSRCRSPCGGA